jgi:hypothetical protein
MNLSPRRCRYTTYPFQLDSGFYQQILTADESRLFLAIVKNDIPPGHKGAVYFVLDAGPQNATAIPPDVQNNANAANNFGNLSIVGQQNPAVQYDIFNSRPFPPGNSTTFYPAPTNPVTIYIFGAGVSANGAVIVGRAT